MALEITNLRVLSAAAPQRRSRRAGGLDAQDQGHRDPAGAHRADDAGGRPVRAAVPDEALEDGFEGPAVGPDYAAPLAAAYCNLRKASIYGGSNEIQRNIIAKMILGL